MTEMEEETRKLDLRPLLAVVAVVAVALTMWAAGAFAAGGSSPSSDAPAVVADSDFVQDGDEGQAPSREDCPKRGGGDGSDGSGLPDL
ncbi:MAG: hypothetical protein ACRDKU_01230 [Gaiellaceae bacterium]